MIIPLDLIVEGANVKGLPTIEQISQGHRHNMFFADGYDNSKLFAWKFLYSDYLVESSKFWKDQILVDLGCGRSLDGYIIAKISGAKAYVAVDPFNLTKFHERLTDPEECKGNGEFNEFLKKAREFIQGIQTQKYDEKIVRRIIENIDSHFRGDSLDVSLIAEDMVTALRRFPNDSVSILTAGLDKCIIWKDEYAELAEIEINRVLDPKGAYLSMDSRLRPKYLKRDISFMNNNFEKFTK